MDGTGTIISVGADAAHRFSKPPRAEIELLAGLGVAGDAHLGVTVQHRSRVARDPSQPNLRQVHLVAGETLDDLRGNGFDLNPGDIGENVLTRGIDLLALPRGTRLYLGAQAVVEVTGLRNPCHQLNDFRPGLMHALLDKDAEGRLIMKAGVMSVVVAGGMVHPGDGVCIDLPARPHVRLERV